HLTSMNLNGAEYFYLRNAQGDIIGLIDGDGVRVVSYAYDSWGKLISIKDKDGKDVATDTNHVGVKNPYRYRGYRYDNETGLYYLNSRYYNPEWGRFINADGLIGKTGDLLGHNLFAYCENNAINASDPTGFMVTYADVGGTSYYTQNITSLYSNEIAEQEIKNKVVNNAAKYTGNTAASIASSSADSYFASKVASSWSSKIFTPLTFKDAVSRNLGKQYFTMKISKITGPLGVASLGISIWDNHANYKYGWLRTGVDVASFGFAAGVGVLAGAFLAPTFVVTAGVIGVGLAIGIGTGEIKDRYLSQRK
ncbi:RHS repeat-associated core domain-containing protein, partial [Desnuesiella massiliensis]|uniref:RHS repeat-associated core domain-containing protein n=1 Tax=Desnuesiella massiliensis TaxID=1650662 RepID=UPI000A442CC6